MKSCVVPPFNMRFLYFYCCCHGYLPVMFAGGLAAVIYTDTLQAFVMVVGATVLTVIGKATYYSDINCNIQLIL